MQMVDMKLIWLFVIGVFLSFLFFVEELITENTRINELSKWRLLFLLVANSIIGGVIAVTVYYGLHQYFPELNDYFLVGVSVSTAMLGKDGIHLYHKFIKGKIQ